MDASSPIAPVVAVCAMAAWSSISYVSAPCNLCFGFIALSIMLLLLMVLIMSLAWTKLYIAGEYLNISYLSPYLESLGSDFKHGADFAIAGATTQAYATNPFTLRVQVRQFLHFRSRSLELIAQGAS